MAIVLGPSEIIVATLTPAVPIGTFVYYQSGSYGVGKGLLLALTNTPTFTKMLVTSNGLKKVY